MQKHAIFHQMHADTDRAHDVLVVANGDQQLAELRVFDRKQREQQHSDDQHDEGRKPGAVHGRPFDDRQPRAAFRALEVVRDQIVVDVFV